jgi:hypothetical protein
VIYDTLLHLSMGGTDMRSHHFIAVAAVFVVGVGLKWFFFSTPPVEAGIQSPTLNILQIQTDYPNMKDMAVLEPRDPV